MDLQGYCPMGCGQTLHATGAGFITCLNRDCPRPAAVTQLLTQRDVIEHRVIFGQDEFVVIHPLRERFGDLIAHCPLDEYLRRLPGPPVALGEYLAEQQSDGMWVYSAWAEVGI